MSETQIHNPPAPIVREMEAVSGRLRHAIVTNFYFCTSWGFRPEDPDKHTGHVWAEVQCGMSVNRINMTPSEAREFARMLVEVADEMEAQAQ